MPYPKNSPVSAFLASRRPQMQTVDLARQQAVGQIVDARRLATLSPDARASDPEILRRVPQSVYDPGDYGDEIDLPIAFSGFGEILALSRPKNTRIYLCIQNQLAAATIVFTFDQVANAGNGKMLLAGQSYIYDSRVPQNDLHIFAPAAGVVMVSYINIDLPNSRG